MQGDEENLEGGFGGDQGRQIFSKRWYQSGMILLRLGVFSFWQPVGSPCCWAFGMTNGMTTLREVFFG